MNFSKSHFIIIILGNWKTVFQSNKRGYFKKFIINNLRKDKKMRFIIFFLGVGLIECLSKHWGIELLNKTDGEFMMKFLIWYAIILDVIKK